MVKFSVKIYFDFRAKFTNNQTIVSGITALFNTVKTPL